MRRRLPATEFRIAGAEPISRCPSGAARTSAKAHLGACASKARRPMFGHLKSAGKWLYSTPELASFWIDEGRLWGEWAGIADCSEPRRLDLGDLDAEWMAFAPAASPGHGEARWLLSRRDLQPSADGRYWSVYWYGSMADPGALHILAAGDTSVHSDSTRSVHLSYLQRPDYLRFTTWRYEAGRRRADLDFSADDLMDLLSLRRDEVIVQLAVPLRNLTGLQLG